MSFLFSRFGISWAHEEWTFLLLFVPLVIALYSLSRKKRREALRLLGIQGSDRAYDRPRLRPFKSALSVIGLGLLIIAALGPQWGQKEHAVKSQGLDLCLALDLSKSMLAEDLSPNRLTSAKNSLTLFLPRLGGDRVTVVGFAGSSYVAAPLSIDHQALLSFVDVLEPDFLSDTSTNIPQALETCLTALGIEKAKSSEEIFDNSSKTILVISDGEDTVNDDNDVPKRLKKLGVPVYAMAVGTHKGGPIPLRDENKGLKSYVRDPGTNQPAVTILQDKYLRSLTTETGGQLFYAERGIGAWNELEAALGTLKRDAREAGKRIDLEARFVIPLLLAFICLLLDFFLPETSVSLKDFRDLFKVGVLLLCTWPLAHAEVRDPRAVYKNNRAIRDFDNDKALEGLEKQNEALAIDAQDLQLRYNWATGRLRAAPQSNEKLPSGEPAKVNRDFINQALKEFDAIEKEGARDTSPDARLREARVRFQKGAALEMIGENQKALESYYLGLAKNSRIPDSLRSERDKLAEMFRTNISRLITKNQENQKNSQSNSGGGGGGGEGKKPSDPQKGDQGQTPPPKDGADADQRQRPEKFTGSDINEQQAKQILQSVSGEEKDVLKRKARSESKEKHYRNGAEEGDETPRGKPW